MMAVPTSICNAMSPRGEDRLPPKAGGVSEPSPPGRMDQGHVHEAWTVTASRRRV